MLKTIGMTVIATLLIVSVITSLFLNSILAVFGLTATSVKAMGSLHASHELVETLKERHDKKKKNLNQRAGKRISKRVAASAVAAATVGTVVVTAAVASFEAEDYCAEREALISEGNLLFGTEETFDYDRCLSDTLDDAKQGFSDLKDASAESIHKTLDSLTSISESYLEQLKVEGESAMQSASEVIDELIADFTAGMNRSSD